MGKQQNNAFEHEFPLNGFDRKTQRIIRNALLRLRTASPELYKYAQSHIGAIVGSGVPQRQDAFLNPSQLSSRSIPDIIKEFYVMQTLVDNTRLVELSRRGIAADSEELKLDAEFFALAVFDACFPSLPEGAKSQVGHYRELMEESLNKVKERLGQGQFSIATHFELCGFDIKSEQAILQAIKTLECYPDLLDYVKKYVWIIILTQDRTDLAQGECQLTSKMLDLPTGANMMPAAGNTFLLFWIIADAEQHRLAEEADGIFDSFISENFAQIQALEKLSENIIKTASVLELWQEDWIYRMIAMEIKKRMEKQLKDSMTGITILQALYRQHHVQLSPEQARKPEQIEDEINFSLETNQALDDLIGDENYRLLPNQTNYGEIQRLLFEVCSSWNGIATLFHDLSNTPGIRNE